MILGIHLNSDRHLNKLTEISRAAVDKGHTVSVFVMSRGILLLTEKEMGELASVSGVEISYCALNAEQMKLDIANVSADIRAGSQLDNAIMVRDSDRVICL